MPVSAPERVPTVYGEPCPLSKRGKPVTSDGLSPAAERGAADRSSLVQLLMKDERIHLSVVILNEFELCRKLQRKELRIRFGV